jgi:hypothetical protein
MNNQTKLLLSGLLTYALTVAPKVSADYKNGWANTPSGAPTVEQNPEVLITNVTTYLLGFIILIAVLIIIYGGVIYLTAAGNDDRVGQAKKTISAGVIGLVICGLAYAIVAFVKTILAA